MSNVPRQAFSKVFQFCTGHSVSGKVFFFFFSFRRGTSTSEIIIASVVSWSASRAETCWGKFPPGEAWPSRFFLSTKKGPVVADQALGFFGTAAALCCWFA